MAAAEYYNAGGAPSQASSRPSQLQPPTGQQNPPYPMFDGPPPPYSPTSAQPRPHSQPPPQQRVHFDTTTPHPGAVPRPQPQLGDTHQYPAEKWSQQHQQQRQTAPLQNTYHPSDFRPQGPSQYPQPPHPPLHQQQQQPPQQFPGPYYPPPGSGPNAMGQVYGSQQFQPRRNSSTPATYERYGDDDDVGAGGRSHSRHRYHHDQRPTSGRKKSSGVNTFLGAGGGAIVGDLIFPGLGTLGGAILGGIGGHEYSRQRAEYGPSGSSRPRGGARARSNSGNDGYYYEDDHRRGRR